MNPISKIKSLLNEKDGKELIKGSFWALLFRVVGIVISYLFIVLITRYYGASAMGIFALCTALLMMSVTFSKIGFDNAFLRFSSTLSNNRKWGELKDVYQRAMLIVIPTAIAISLIVYFFADDIATYLFKKPNLGYYFRITSFAILPMTLTFIHAEGFRGMKRIRTFLMLKRVLPYTLAMVILLTLYNYKGEEIPLIAYLAGVGVTFLISIAGWWKSSSLFSTDRVEHIKSSGLLKIAVPMFLSGSMFMVMNWTDTFLLGIFKTKADVGIYNVAFRAANVATITLFAINSIAAPKIAESYGNRDISGLRQTVHRSSAMIFWSTVPIVAILLIVPTFIMGLFGSEFHEGSTVLMILACSQFVNAASGSVMYILQMTGNQNAGFWIMFAGATINLVLNIILIPIYGIEGAAIASLISMAFWNISCIIYIRRKLKILTLYLPFAWKK